MQTQQLRLEIDWKIIRSVHLTGIIYCTVIHCLTLSQAAGQPPTGRGGGGGGGGGGRGNVQHMLHL
jgi:hypothetical protein